MMLEVTARTSKRASYSAHKDSGVEWLGNVPAHWELKRLKFSASINDEALPETTDPDMYLSYVDIGSVHPIRGIDSMAEMAFEDAPSRARRIVRDGDTIISTVRTYLRAVAAIRNPVPNTIVSTGFAVVRPRSVSPPFISYVLSEQGFIEAIMARSVGVSYPAINASEIGMLSIPLPPLSEQRAIADFLDRETEKIDTLVAKKRTLIERLKEEHTALITHTVTRGLPPEAARAAGLEPHPKLKSSGIEWLGDVPEHWEICKLKRVTISRCDGPFGSSLKSEHYSNAGVRVIRLQNIRFARFDDRDAAFIEPEYYEELGDHNVLPYDLLIAGLGDENYPVGRACVAPSALGPAMVKADCFRFRLMTDRANSAYVALQLSTIANALAGALATGTTRGRMNLANTENRDIALPPLSEQTAIADFLDRKTAKIDTLVTKIETAIERLQEYRSALITAAVTGKIDVRKDWEKKLISKRIEDTEGGKFLTSINKKAVDILSSARDKNLYDEDFLNDYNILNFYENVSNFVGLRSLFPNSFSEDGVDLQNLKREYREWMRIDETKELFERSIRYGRGRHFKKYVEAAKKNLSSKCLEPNCPKKAIGSHLISQKYLKFISCKDNKIREIGLFTDPKKMADSFESKMRKNPFILIEHILNPKSNHFKEIKESSEKFGTANRQGRSSRLTPIHYASQFYGYCSKHDSEIYRCFENNDFDPNNRQHLNLIMKRTFDYLYRYIDETCKLRPQELLETAKNDEQFFHYLKSIFATRQAFDNPENMRDDFFHLTYVVKSEKPSILACSRDLSLHGSITREVSENNKIKKKTLRLCGPMFLNIFPIRETETLVCISFLNDLYFRLFTDQLQSEDIALEDLRNAILSNNEKRINKEISKLILDRTDTLYLREEFYQTLMRKGFKENLSDFMPTDELNFLNY